MSRGVIIIYTEGFNLKSPLAPSKYINYELPQWNYILESCGLKVLTNQRKRSPIRTSQDDESFSLMKDQITTTLSPNWK